MNLKECFAEKDGVLFLDETIEGDRDVLRETALTLLKDDAVIVLSNEKGDVVVFCGKKAVEKGLKANELIKECGRGGGSPAFAQGIKQKKALRNKKNE